MEDEGMNMVENRESIGTASYSLALSEQERTRYRIMAAAAAENEASEWLAAGILEGAAVADVGCGPGAVLRLLAERVGPTGRATGIDADPAAVADAREDIGELSHAEARTGLATETDLEPGGWDVVMCRHVLAHNGGREQAIVDHLASLVRRGGCVYLADIDFTAVRMTADSSDLQDLAERYSAFQHARGNDLSVGLRLGDLLTKAGLVVERYACRAPVIRIMPGVRPPSWAARAEMVHEGFATDNDLDRWAKAFATLDKADPRPWLFPATFVAIGRRAS
jgi:2-polyprenyl-3-methyl-5-hydroxy-6-metoxy-1,4-benzoquinol methylase